MKQSVKKRIAKEALIIVGFILFIPLFYGGFYLKNLYFESKTESLKSEVDSLDPYEGANGDKLLLRFDYAQKMKNDFEGIYGLTKDDFKDIDLIIKQIAYEEYEREHLFDDFPVLEEKESSWDEVPTAEDSKLPEDFNQDSTYIEIPLKPSLIRKEGKFNLERIRSPHFKAIDLLLSKEESKVATAEIKKYLFKKNEWKSTSNKITSFRKMTPYLIWWLIILSSIAYPLRGIYFLLKWAIKTVNS